MVVQVHSSAHGYPVFPAPFFEKTVPCTANGLTALVESRRTRTRGVIPGPGLFLGPCGLAPLDHRGFVGQDFQSQDVGLPRFVLLFRHCFGVRVRCFLEDRRATLSAHPAPCWSPVRTLIGQSGAARPRLSGAEARPKGGPARPAELPRGSVSEVSGLVV